MAEVKVLVIGAGPTGLALACALLERGITVRVLDRAPGPATTSRALGLQPRGVEVLNRLGALGDLPARGRPIEITTINAGHRELTRIRVTAASRRSRHAGVIISQAEIEAELRRRLGELGGKVEWAHELVSATQDRTGVTAVVRHAETEHRLTADWLVGCDGAHSRVRKVAGIGFPGVPIAERFLLADVHLDWERDASEVSTWLHPDGMFSAFPLPEPNRWRLMAEAPGEDGDVLDLLRELMPRRTGHPGVRLDDVVWTSSFRIHRRLADNYRAGRMLLAGDAAHIHSPFGGQGMNTGIGDAENLAWKLALVAGGRAEPALLDSYQAERRPVAEGVLASTSAMTSLLLDARPLRRLVRDRVLVPLMGRPAVQRVIIERSSQIGVHYRSGPLGAGRSLPWEVGSRPGDRLPEVACRRADGSSTSLHIELHGRWALLLPAGSDSAANEVVQAARQRLGDEVVVLTRDWGNADEVLLVRPDAHLGWRGRPEPAKLGQWLDRVLRLGKAR